MFGKTFTFWRNLRSHTEAERAETTTTGTQEDRRLWVRYATDLQGKVQFSDNGEKPHLLARICDLSQGGANLHVDEKMVPGQMITLELPGDRGECHEFLACVVRVVSLKKGAWSVGCVFSRELTSDELHHIGAKKEPAGENDQRTWVRYACGLKAKCGQVGDRDNASHSAQVLNISATGIALSVSPSLHAGALLNVELFDKDGHSIRTILACVVHTTLRSGGDYVAGCNFIRELNETELHALI